MIREQFVDSRHLLEVETKEKWFELLNQGYIGNQSGNQERIYFVGEKMGIRVIYAKTIREIDLITRPTFELDKIEELKINLSSGRTYWILTPADLKLPLVKEAICIKQNNVIESPITLQEHYSDKLDFSEELL